MPQLKIQRLNTYKVQVSVDDEPWKILSATGVRQALLPEEVECESLVEVEAWYQLWERQQIKIWLLTQLSQKDCAETELRKRLNRIGFSSEAIDVSLTLVQSYVDMNDQAWMERYVRGQKQKKRSLSETAMKLKIKGFSTDQLESVVHQQKNHDISVLRQLMKSKYMKYNLKLPKERQKVVASLARKGFRWEDISEVLDVDFNDFDDLDE